MAERSARDRDGVGSTPTSGLHTANPGYAASQLAKALSTAEQHEDADTRERAQQKAQKWASVFSQNLAPLLSGLGLVEPLRPQLADMARQCFVWICRRQQIPESNWHARLITVKNTAYAWRQMLVYLSLVSADDLAEFITWGQSHLQAQRPEFHHRFRPALDGLAAASQGQSPAVDDQGRRSPRRFLGWSKSRHWLLD